MNPIEIFSKQISGSDHQNINMLAFRHVNQIEITGNVVTDRQYISTLKVSSTMGICHLDQI